MTRCTSARGQNEFRENKRISADESRISSGRLSKAQNSERTNANFSFTTDDGIAPQREPPLGEFYSKVCDSRRGVWELNREGGLRPIFSPTKMKVGQNSFDCLSFCSSSCLLASLSACLPVFLPFYLPYGLSCFPIFFLSPLFPSFTVRRQGGLLDQSALENLS